MNFVKKNILKTAFLLLILTLFACNMNPSDSGGNSGNGKILLSLSAKVDSSSRLISPITNPSISGYQLYGAVAGGTQTLLNSYTTLTDATVTLLSGTWDFTLKGLNSSDEVFLSGDKNGVVIGSAPISIEFVLKPLVTGSSPMSVSISWPDTVPVASVVTTFDGVVVSPGLTIEENSVTFIKGDATAGSHVLSFNLQDSGNNTLQIYTDIVIIYPGMVTWNNITPLTEESFNSAPAAPSGLSVSHTTGDAVNGVVNLTWTDNSTSETGFEIYLDDGTTLVGIANPGETSYSDTTAPRGSTRTYKIRGINAIGNSDWATSGIITIPWLLSFDTKEGSYVNGIESLTDSTVTIPTDPTYLGHTFNGWFKDAEYTNNWNFDTDTVGTNITIYSEWIIHTHTITYNPNEALGGVVPEDTESYDYGTNATVLGNTGSLVKAPLGFKGWNTDPGGTGTDYAVGAQITLTANVTLYAKWAVVYTITYDGNGKTDGTVPVDITMYESDDTGTVSSNTGNLVKTSYGFRGWNTEPGGTGTDYTVNSQITLTANITLYAKWGDIVGSIGPAGGYIFYDKGTESAGWRYLEAAPGDISGTKIWGTPNHTVSGADGMDIGTGKQNTLDIIAGDPTTDNAARACDAHTVTHNGTTYTDWFLPSRDELIGMYDKLKVEGLGGFQEEEYWSSSASIDNYPNYHARTMVFWGLSDYGVKDDYNLVRPARAF